MTKKKCPKSFNADTMISCIEERCAWWIEKYGPEGLVTGDCAILVIAQVLKEASD